MCMIGLLHLSFPKFMSKIPSNKIINVSFYFIWLAIYSKRNTPVSINKISN